MSLPKAIFKNNKLGACLLAATLFVSSCSADTHSVSLTPPPGKAIAVFAEGCFWCSELIYGSVPGVDSAVSGYAGGHTKNPTYGEVTSETTGHAECVMVYYDPKIVSYNQLLKVFFASVNPTQVNQEGNDIGTSYRSILFYKNAEEMREAKAAIAAESKNYTKPIATQLVPLKTFYRAEEYHQNYIAHNPGNSYVINVSIPRYKAFRAKYKGNLRAKSTF